MTDASTADPKSARSHARAMAGTRVAWMPTVPATDAEAPEGVSPADLLWEETLAPGGYASKELSRGSRLRLIDVDGDACVSMLLFNAERPIERLNVADTIKLQWQAYLGAGSLLLSDMGRVLASVLEDSAQTHDVFCGASNERSNERRYAADGQYGRYPNARQRLLLGAGKFGLGRRDVHPCVNWFKAVRVAADGTLKYVQAPNERGRHVTLRFEMNLIVVVANCPHVLDPRTTYSVTPARLTAWRGPITSDTDLIRNASPESERAFINVEEYFRR